MVDETSLLKGDVRGDKESFVTTKSGTAGINCHLRLQNTSSGHT